MKIETRFWKHGLYVAVALVLAGCQSIPVAVNVVQQKPQLTIPLGQRLAPIKLDSVSVKLKRGALIGEYINNRGFGEDFCKASVPNIYWNQGRAKFWDLELQDRFYEAFKAANYNVIGDPNKLFASESRDKIEPDYLVGAQVTEISMQVCDEYSRWTALPARRQNGKSSIKVKWQVFSPVLKKVVFEAYSEGAGALRPGVPDGEIALIDAAFSNAAENFAADPKMLELVSNLSPTVADIRKVDNVILEIKRQNILTDPIQTNIDRVRLGVVTLDSGRAHGSGFFISPTYIMTNNHVVEGQKFIKVRLLTGRELLGEVVRKHPERDVAIVQVERGGHRPIPIRMEPVKITEEVYAIGTPKERRLKGTVSKGIVSSFRSNQYGMEDIQADVDVHGGNSGGALVDKNGNVVGVTYAGAVMLEGKVSAGLNLFIPIYDALKKLNIELKDFQRDRK
ncbi:MAG: trypsin-like peptidase domain-containing protein [Rhodospirillales bacterium]|nr:trypsin-like peptidase domain-containing protein [Rhodospirillales bacterium]